jgi:hypothetical protein
LYLGAPYVNSTVIKDIFSKTECSRNGLKEEV